VHRYGLYQYHPCPYFKSPVKLCSPTRVEIGQKATEMLLSPIKSKWPVAEFETVVLPTHLFVRESFVKTK